MMKAVFSKALNHVIMSCTYTYIYVHIMWMKVWRYRVLVVCCLYVGEPTYNAWFIHKFRRMVISQISRLTYYAERNTLYAVQSIVRKHQLGLRLKKPQNKILDHVRTFEVKADSLALPTFSLQFSAQGSSSHGMVLQQVAHCKHHVGWNRNVG